MGKVVNFAAIYEISTQLEVNTSPKASTDAAFNADEFIFSPTYLLNLLSHNFIIKEIISKTKGIISKVTAIGFNILSSDVFINFTPTSITINATISADKYSILP